MRINGSWARSGILAVAIAAFAALAVPRAQSTDVSLVLQRVGSRVAEYYKRAQHIICTEKVYAQPIDSSYSAEGLGRSLEYELHIESDAAEDGEPITEATIVRELRKVNGRTPRPNDKAGCFDPKARAAEPLAFLLPNEQHDYTFTSAAFGKGKDKNLLILEYLRTEPGKPEFKEDPGKREECFQITLPFKKKGRVWINPETYDVVRVDEQLASRADFRVPFDMQRKHNLSDVVTIERWETSTKYGVVKFTNPEESMLLPLSTEEVSVIRGSLLGHRKHQEFTAYRRFLTGGRIVK